MAYAEDEVLRKNPSRALPRNSRRVALRAMPAIRTGRCARPVRSEVEDCTTKREQVRLGVPRWATFGGSSTEKYLSRKAGKVRLARKRGEETSRRFWRFSFRVVDVFPTSRSPLHEAHSANAFSDFRLVKCPSTSWYVPYPASHGTRAWTRQHLRFREIASPPNVEPTFLSRLGDDERATRGVEGPRGS